MKKAIAILLILSSLCLFFSCGGYDPVDSTDEEARVVMTISMGEATYEIKYELYRALFLNHKSEIDGGDSSVWSGENKSDYIADIDAVIIKEISRIYGAIHLAKTIGFDVLSSRYDDDVEEIITASVDGGEVGGQVFDGFGGDYNKYLAYLKSQNLNYSVQDLLIRYAIALEEIYTYYTPSVEGAQGEITYTDTDLLAYYNNATTVRVLALFLDDKIFDESSANSARDYIAQNNGTEDAAIRMISYSTSGASDIMNGMIVSRYSLDAEYYSELSYAALSLELFEVSEPIYVTTPDASGYYILYRAEKSDDHFNTSRELISETYVNEEIGKRISGAMSEVIRSIAATDVLTTLDYAAISMN